MYTRAHFFWGSGKIVRTFFGWAPPPNWELLDPSLAGSLTDDPDKCTVISGDEAKEAVAYHAFHEEADDRMMFSIHQLYKKYTIDSPFIKDSLSITVVTPDTDIFVVLMYHLKKHLGIFWVILTEERANNNATKTSVRFLPPPSSTLQIRS